MKLSQVYKFVLLSLALSVLELNVEASVRDTDLVHIGSNAEQSKKDNSEVYKLNGKSASSYTLAGEQPQFMFLWPEIAGSLKLGISIGEESFWFDDLKVKKISHDIRKVSYSVSDKALRGGNVLIEVFSLRHTDGVVIKISAEKLPDNSCLYWAYGGASGKAYNESQEQFGLDPLKCKYNVFSVEHTAFTVYYGESMKLRTVNAVMPVKSEIRLSDAHNIANPIILFESGKKTEAPVLCGKLPIANSAIEYICVYKQNAEADYNHYMLSALFENELVK